MGMTRADKFEEIFGYRPATDQVICNEHDYCGGSDACNYCMCNSNNIGREEDWWNAEYKEPTIEHEQEIDKLAMMHEIYMAGVNMAGEYQGCWVRFKEIEKIVDRHMR